jgi:tripartite-type tricarboxylate transporter receptor subunit TctC
MWRGVLAPKGTPPAIVDKLEAAFRKMSEDKSFQALIKQLGDEVDFQGAKDFEATWRQEWDVAAKVVAGTLK